MFKILISISLITILFTISIDGQTCNIRSDFVTECQRIQGVVNGGRCFFVAYDPHNIGIKRKANWKNGFGVCSGLNASLAQIHTRSEWLTITSGLKAFLGTWAWIAAQRHGPLAPGKIDLNKTNWFLSNGTIDTRLSGSNTYMRLHAGDHTLTDNAQPCIHITTNHFADFWCTGEMYVLCVKYTEIQTFALVPKMCLNESIIEASSQAVWSNQCADYCARNQWCRSFNVRDGGTMCEFFTWYHMDVSKKAKSNVEDCAHYAYVP